MLFGPWIENGLDLFMLHARPFLFLVTDKKIRYSYLKCHSYDHAATIFYDLTN